MGFNVSANSLSIKISLVSSELSFQLGPDFWASLFFSALSNFSKNPVSWVKPETPFTLDVVIFHPLTPLPPLCSLAINVCFSLMYSELSPVLYRGLFSSIAIVFLNVFIALTIVQLWVFWYHTKFFLNVYFWERARERENTPAHEWGGAERERGTEDPKQALC